MQDSLEERSKVFWEVQIVRTITSLIAIAVYIGYVCIVKTNFVICMILALELVKVVVDIMWFYQGLEDFRMRRDLRTHRENSESGVCFLICKSSGRFVGVRA